MTIKFFRIYCLSVIVHFFSIQSNFAQSLFTLDKTRWAVKSDSLFRLRKNPEALAFLEAERARLKTKGDTSGRDYLSVVYAFGRHYYKWRDYRSAWPFFEQSLGLHEKLASHNLAEKAGIVSYIGLCVQRIHPQLAVAIQERALALHIAVYGENHHETALAYRDLGVLFGLVLEDFEKGEDYFAKSLRILKAIGMEKHEDYAGFLHNIATMQSSEGRYEEAITSLEQLIPKMKEMHGQSIHTARTISVLGETYAHIGEYTKAHKYQDEAIAMLQKIDTIYKESLGAAYAHVGATYNMEKKPDSALIFIKKAYNVTKDRMESKEKNLSSPYCWQLSISYSLLQQPAKALAYIDTAFLDEDYTLGMPYDSIRIPYFISMLLKEKTKYLIQQYDQDKQLATLQAAKSTLLLAQGIDAQIMERLSNNRSKTAAYNELHKGARLTNQTLLALYARTGDEQYLREAFTASETSKGLLLYQQILAQKKRQASRVPPEMTFEEAELTRKITQKEKQLFESKKPAQQAENERIKEEIFALKKQLEFTRGKINEVCPEYFLLPPPMPKTDVGTLQGSLAQNEAVLEFFTGDSTITTFLVLRDTLLHRHVAIKKDLEAQVGQFRAAMTRYFLAEVKSPDLYLSSATELCQTSHWLYQNLIEPFQAQLPENVTLIPDGVLAYLPFEALLRAKPEQPERFHTHAYMGQQHTLRYTYSTALMREMSETREEKAALPMLAMAPFYDGSTQWHDSLVQQLANLKRADFTPLPFSGEEVFKVSQLTDGEVLTGPKASKEAFLQRAAQYRRLHLATHARANDRTSDYSYICFAPTPQHPQGERLYASEIYGLRLNADLVTLSACETGLGKMLRGEGVVSIARAFASAGARSILQSQWAVSDAKTRYLMTFFYKNLKKGLAKDKALREAKADYLKKFKGEAAHPYFWAGFVLIGK